MLDTLEPQASNNEEIGSDPTVSFTTSETSDNDPEEAAGLVPLSCSYNFLCWQNSLIVNALCFC